MKKSPSLKPNLPQQSSQRKQNANLRYTTVAENDDGVSKRNPALRCMKSAIKKCSGFFRIFVSGKRKSVPEVVERTDRRSASKGRGVSSFSTDVSSGSTVTKSSSKSRFSSAYASSSTASGQLGAGNFSFQEIFKATEKFSPNNKIGEGGFGTVYKGRLNDGSLVAIKRARKNANPKVPLSVWEEFWDVQNRNLSEFKNEVSTLSKIEHLNLVRLYGYLEHQDEKIIIVEYVANGTLREHIDGIRGDELEMGERLDVAIDVAHAVTYLHMYAGSKTMARQLGWPKFTKAILWNFESCSPFPLPLGFVIESVASHSNRQIIHRDIKASNVLITEKLRGKVADFGFARLAEEDHAATHISTQIKGTAGYMDPEYLRTYQLTEKSDVYSFGVLLVEMITGRHPIEPKKARSERVTIRWAMHMLKQGDAVIAMDPRLRRTPASTMAVEKVLKLAHLCLAPLRQSRPTMKSCAEILWSIRKDFRDKLAASHSSVTSHQSSNFPHRDPRKSRHTSFGIEDDDSYKFASA
ncbi:hypothetical protein L6164_028557 [Bauhinia variegata]|uniref:Uncharacterized protein n=1 Tax=Bauhinia variegata TaxID=167791 RepID=A0ACB9L7T9_BAUVA|nr:hypothetical protein L6164_028557 [Bauhinia variegata]